MEAFKHDLANLFSQLGLPNSQKEIDSFVQAHSIKNIALYDANFWNEFQKSFLKEELLNDSDWSPVIDELTALLSSKK